MFNLSWLLSCFLPALFSQQPNLLCESTVVSDLSEDANSIFFFVIFLLHFSCGPSLFTHLDISLLPNI